MERSVTGAGFEFSKFISAFLLANPPANTGMGFVSHCNVSAYEIGTSDTGLVLPGKAEPGNDFLTVYHSVCDNWLLYH